MGDELEALTDVVLVASRALIAVASRSIAAVDDKVTLPQFRALVVLDVNDGSCRVGELRFSMRPTRVPMDASAHATSHARA